MKTGWRRVCSVALTIAAASSSADERQGTGADWVLTHGKVFTSNSGAPWADAVAIERGKFVYVGDDAGAERLVTASTRRTDLGGRLVIPGMVDGHTHPGYIGIERYAKPWLPTTSKAALLNAVKAFADAHPGDGWIRMCCWPDGMFLDGSVDKRDLDGVVGDRPVWLTSAVWHTVWVNSKALQALGIDRNTADPRPGLARYGRYPDGEPDGFITEGAAWQFGVDTFPVEGAAHEREVIRFLEYLSAHGVVAVFDGGNFGHEDRVYALLAKLEREGRLPLRYEGTYQIFIPERRRTAIAELLRLRQRYGGDRLRFTTVKLFMDGVSTNRTAALLEPYADDPQSVGNTMLSAQELTDFLLDLNAAHLDLHVHVLGDRAVRTVLDAVEAAKQRVEGDFYPRVTLAHMGLVDPADFPRIAKLGIVANYTPWWHGVVPNDPVRRALGPQRYARSLLVRPLLDAGGIVSFSSDDWVVEYASPFLGIQVGHLRQSPPASTTGAGRSPEMLPIRGPESERLDLATMLRGYTINGAYQLRMENEIGSIAVGKRGDLVVLDRNLFDMNPADIRDVLPAAVVVDGTLLHGRL